MINLVTSNPQPNIMHHCKMAHQMAKGQKVVQLNILASQHYIAICHARIVSISYKKLLTIQWN